MTPIGKVLESGRVTADLRPKGTPATTIEVGKAVSEAYVSHEQANYETANHH